jgi:quinol monooxygenase YgiN
VPITDRSFPYGAAPSYGSPMTDTESLLLTVAVDIDPAHLGDFHDAVDDLTRTAAEEPGVLEYRVTQELGYQNRFVFIERYVDQDALAAHQQTPACAAYVAALPGWLARPTAAVVDAATRVSSIDLKPPAAEG